MEKYEKLYCPKLNEGEHCPLCEAREALLWKEVKKLKIWLVIIHHVNIM